MDSVCGLVCVCVHDKARSEKMEKQIFQRGKVGEKKLTHRRNVVIGGRE